ncbi:hypothetical protein V8F06_014473 [Rhypophila decipiens]
MGDFNHTDPNHSQQELSFKFILEQSRAMSIAAQQQTPGNTHSMDKGKAIAICGLALRLPGSIRIPEQYWSLLTSGHDARGPMPARRRLDPNMTDQEALMPRLLSR